ncbi:MULTISPECIES: hypothetical protein [unclassified Micromonospora]|uniref:hypothetical protein n=1 Tax=unclassified Micromonospora TaxID=2617518 RepID=UPI001B397559|nr:MULTISPECIES: hypothetical protein [unclassified Micromonospora]MBQ0979148.1 hypothetical protein [Micromonospora sp. M61]MBQ1040407.1 hypothetical protein [Micromonospora sp. C81]
MTDLDERIVQTLRDRAEGTVDTDRLLVGAVRRGRTRVRRRRVSAGATLGVIALLGAGVVAGPLGGLPGLGPTVTPGSAETTVAFLPPLVAGAPGAAARPDQIGKDPALLHIGLAPGGSRFLEWNVGGGRETAKIDVGGRTVTVELTSAELLRTIGAWTPPPVEGLPGNPYDGTVAHADGPDGVPIWRRYWQPTPGVYAAASVSGPDESPLYEAAAALRLDRAYGCAGPVRLTDLPAGVQFATCSMVVGTFPAAYAVMLRVSDDQGRGVTVEFQYAGTTLMAKAPANRMIDGRPAYYDPAHDTAYDPAVARLELLDIPRAQLFTALNHELSLSEADATTVLLGVRVAEHLDRPATW